MSIIYLFTSISSEKCNSKSQILKITSDKCLRYDAIEGDSLVCIKCFMLSFFFFNVVYMLYPCFFSDSPM